MALTKPQTGYGGLDVRVTQLAPFACDVTLTCKAGEVLALLGPSGSGKTTTLRSIAGLNTPAAGRVALGADVWFDAAHAINLRPEQRRCGLVFQDYALFPHLNVLANVTLAMGHVASAERTDRASGLLERMGIAPLAAERPARLSGGERQRVAIARALARDPKVLLLDEPFSAIDRPARQRLKTEVRQLAADFGVPVVLVTHDIEEAVALANSMVIIDAGRTIAHGAPAALIANPPSARIAEILGASFSR